MNDRSPCYIDCHLHLQDERIAPGAAGTIERAMAANVKQLLCNGTNPTDWPGVLVLARSYDCVIPFIGLHPWYVEEAQEGWAVELESMVKTNRCGVGEIGLDFAKTTDRDLQQRVFEKQLAIAAKYSRPVSIHCVKAWGKLIEALQETPLHAGFMVHAFNGSLEIARELTKLGGYVSFSALSLTENRKIKTKELIKALPKKRILFETESPFGLNKAVEFIKSEPQQTNEPANLPAIVSEAAKLTGDDLEAFAEQIFENAKRFVRPLSEISL